MKKILLFTFVLILTACSAQPQVTSTLPPTSTPVPIPTKTPVPTITPTSIPTLAVFSPDDWATMSPDQKLAAVPASPEYTAGNVSTLEGKENYVILRSTDPDNIDETIGAYNAYTGKVETMSDAGIKEFDLNDGTKLELRSFKTASEAKDYIIDEQGVMWMQGGETVRMSATAYFWSDANGVNSSEADQTLKIPGFLENMKALGGIVEGDGSHLGEGEFFPVYRYGFEGNTFVSTRDADGNYHDIFIEQSREEVVGEL